MSFFRKKSRHIFCHTSHLFNRKRGRKDHSGSRWKTTLFCFDDNPIPSMYGIFTYIWLFLMIKGLKQEVMLRITGTPWNEQQKPLITGHLQRKVINLPTINFQVLLLLVSGRVAANEIDRIQMSLWCFFLWWKGVPPKCWWYPIFIWQKPFGNGMDEPWLMMSVNMCVW